METRAFSAILPLAMLSALTALSTDIALPLVHPMAEAFGASVAQISGTFGMFFAAYAVGQLLFGPLSDRFGRRAAALGGLTVYVLASAAAAYASSLRVYELARILQGLSACAGPITAMAIIADRYDRNRAARLNAAIDVLVATAPLLAPLLGAWLGARFGWSAPLAALAVAGVVLLPVAARLPRERSGAPTPVSPWSAYGAVLSDSKFRWLALANAATLGALLSVLSFVPAYLSEVFQASESSIATFIATNAVAMLLGGVLAERCTRFGGMRVTAGLGAASVGLAAMVTLLWGGLSQGGLQFGVGLATFGVAMLLPTTLAAALDRPRGHKGTAAALLGAGRFATGGLMGSVACALGVTSPTPLALMFGLSAVAVSVSLRQGFRGERNVGGR